MSGWWALKNLSINIMNFVFDNKHKNNDFVQGLCNTQISNLDRIFFFYFYFFEWIILLHTLEIKNK
jgi:hypothetical protein